MQNKPAAAPKPNRLVWIDLEMTGLDPKKDVILEIATIVTDLNLITIAQGPDIVIYQPDSVLNGMEKVVAELHDKSGLTKQVRAADTTIQEAEQQTLGFLRNYCEEKLCLLAGNSVWMDKFFLLQHMPRLAAFMHYRIIDVSTVKT